MDLIPGTPAPPQKNGKNVADILLNVILLNKSDTPQ
jgi:hypothetical protein